MLLDSDSAAVGRRYHLQEGSMFRRADRFALILATTGFLAAAHRATAAPLQVVSVSPARLGIAATTAAVSITFDQAVLPSSVTTSSFRVFGKQSGAASGPFTFSNANQTVTLTPSRPFAVGEVVHVNLSHALQAADTSPLRSAGYTYQFRIQTAVASRNFTQIQQMSNRTTPGINTRIYGSMAADLNGDGWVDLTTVNEDSFDLRVFMNRADGTGLFGGFLTPEPIGQESSPNESGDLDNDGKIDIVVSATTSEEVWLVRGAGDGTWASSQHLSVGAEPHGVAVLDVDGDGDWDVANANHGGNDLTLMINNNGTLAAPTHIEAGGNGEYALQSGDMNNDGISDLVVGLQDDQEIVVLLGNGDGTFAPQTPQPAGGRVWKFAVGDLNDDGKLDCAIANEDGVATVLLGNGDGTFQAPATYPISGTGVGSVLGDLDDDGDLDWVVSSFSGGRWHVFVNDGTGTFTEDPEIIAISNPSCATMLDVDGDGDLDLSLTDEIADVVRILRNDAGATPLCPDAPDFCRQPAPGKGNLLMVDKADDTKDRLTWKWTKGAATTKAEFGDPINTDEYALCFYDGGTLLTSAVVAGTCGTKPCWSDKPTGFVFRNKNKTVAPSGIQSVTLKAGAAGKAGITVKGKGVSLALPAPGGLSGPIDVQLHRNGSGICWGATFSPPFKKNTGGVLKDASDL